MDTWNDWDSPEPPGQSTLEMCVPKWLQHAAASPWTLKTELFHMATSGQVNHMLKTFISLHCLKTEFMQTPIL